VLVPHTSTVSQPPPLLLWILILSVDVEAALVVGFPGAGGDVAGPWPMEAKARQLQVAPGGSRSSGQAGRPLDRLTARAVLVRAGAAPVRSLQIVGVRAVVARVGTGSAACADLLLIRVAGEGPVRETTPPVGLLASLAVAPRVSSSA